MCMDSSSHLIRLARLLCIQEECLPPRLSTPLLRSHSPVVRGIRTLESKAVSIVCHSGGPIREDGLDAHLLREDVQDYHQLAICVGCVVDGCVVVVVVGLDAGDGT
jgi:hypothetical protein